MLLLRLGVGGTFLAHGLQKVFGLWGGPGINGFAQFLESLGFRQAHHPGLGHRDRRAGRRGASWSSALATPLAAAGLLGIMINVVLLKLGNGFFLGGPDGPGGFELELVLGLAAAALVLTGPGRIALDNGRAWHRRPASWGVLCLVIGVAAAILIRVLLHADPPPEPCPALTRRVDAASDPHLSGAFAPTVHAARRSGKGAGAAGVRGPGGRRRCARWWPGRRRRAAPCYRAVPVARLPRALAGVHLGPPLGQHLVVDQQGERAARARR